MHIVSIEFVFFFFWNILSMNNSTGTSMTTNLNKDYAMFIKVEVYFVR